MTINEIQSYIKNTLLRKDGNVNTAITRRDYFKNSKEKLFIYEITNWLPNNTPLRFRLYTIINNIFDFPKCNQCGKNNVHFIIRHSSFSDLCYECKEQKRKGLFIDSFKRNVELLVEEYLLKTEKKVSTDTMKEILNSRSLKINWVNFLINNKIYKQFLNHKYYNGSYVETAYRIKHDIEDIPKCPVCGSPTKFKGNSYNTFCSKRCTVLSKETRHKAKITSLKRYGVTEPNKSEEIKKKKMDTNIKLYGDHPMRIPFFKEKLKKTFLRKYGVDNPMKLDFFKEKSRNTCLLRYGVDNPMKLDSVKEKGRNTCLLRYGVEHWMQLGLHNGYKCKEYILPNSETVKIQGYEHFLLDEVFQEYCTEEVILDRKLIPKFWYFTQDGRKHRYIPDLYIPSTNTIYEVKSPYTLKKGMENNIFQLKRQSVLSAGYKFQLKVYNDKGKSIDYEEK